MDNPYTSPQHDSQSKPAPHWGRRLVGGLLVVIGLPFLFDAIAIEAADAPDIHPLAVFISVLVTAVVVAGFVLILKKPVA
jgi:hypothetical protein